MKRDNDPRYMKSDFSKKSLMASMPKITEAIIHNETEEGLEQHVKQWEAQGWERVGTVNDCRSHSSYNIYNQQMREKPKAKRKYMKPKQLIKLIDALTNDHHNIECVHLRKRFLYVEFKCKYQASDFIDIEEIGEKVNWGGDMNAVKIKLKGKKK